MAKILIVDDEASNREFLVTLLGYANHEVIQANDGNEGLLAVHEHRPELIIADVLMPTIDGFEFVRRLRADDRVSHIPVIFCTGYYLERGANDLAVQVGVSQILSRPTEPEAVLRAVENVLTNAGSTTIASPPVEFQSAHRELLSSKLSEQVEQTRFLNHRLGFLLKISENLALERDPVRLLESVGRGARELIGAQQSALAILNNGKGEWKHFATSGLDSYGRENLLLHSHPIGRLASLLSNETCLRMNGTDLSSTELGLPDGYPHFSSLLAVRISSPSRIYGWLCLTNKLGAGEFSDEDAQSAATLGSLVGRVYENGSLYAEVERRAAQLEREVEERKQIERALAEDATVGAALNRVGSELIVNLESPDLMNALGRITTDALACAASFTLFLQPEENILLPIAGFSDIDGDVEAIRGLTLPKQLTDELTETFAREEVVELTSPIITALTIPGNTPGRLLGMALRRGDSLIGIQVAARRDQGHSFTAAQWRIARGIARAASLVIEHARVRQKLEKSNQVKSDFVATMSHELRTPLNIIMGYTELVVEGEFGTVNQEQHEALKRVARSATELLELINSTLDLSQLEREHEPINLEDVDLEAVLRDSLAEILRFNEKPGLEFGGDIEAALPRLRTDSTKLRIILRNLLGNAYKFTESGTVILAARRLGDGVEISVSDTGIGIPADILPIIFEPFRQGESTMTRRFGGVGLGLYIVNRLLRILAGRITVESEVGRGSIFRLWLPLSYSDHPTE